MTSLALMVGSGDLPAALIAALPQRPLVCALEGFFPDGVTPDLTFRLERLALVLRDLARRGIQDIVFAGSVRRPRLDPALFDPATAQLVPRLLTALKDGDDATLRGIIDIFESDGFRVLGVADIAPDLLPGPGLLAGQVTARDKADATRAAAIVAALGAVDVGQAAVVAQGQCLAIEALPGTDAMLRAVAGLGALRPDPTQGRGLLYKAAKPGQDRRVDLPTIGAQTLTLAAEAGLGGVAFQAGAVICLDLDALIATADQLGLYLWSRP